MLLYLIFIFATVLIITLSGLIFLNASKKVTDALFTGFILSFIGFFVLVLICLGINNKSEEKYNDLEKTYKYLTLYQPLIEESEDEYVRCSFYNQVNEYNNEYKSFIKDSTNFWTSNLYPKTSLNSIDFYLNGDPSNSINF